MGGTSGIFGSVVLDVAIGLAFIYLLLAILCTAVNEWLAGIFKTRGKLLAQGIHELLNAQSLGTASLVDQFYQHPLITSMMRPSGPHPTYLSARIFSTVLLDLVTAGKIGKLEFADLEAAVDGLPDGDVKRALTALLRTSDRDLAAAQKKIEGWFDDSMDRVSGWYKRRTQIWTIATALVLTLAVNADTLHVAQRLWTDPALRAQVVEEARVRASKPRPSTLVEYIDRDPLKPTVKPGEGDRLSDQERGTLGQMIGWNQATLKANGALDWLARVIGWILTIIAISLGAPFWFDLLNRFMNVRNAGRSPDEAAKKPEKRKLPPEDKAA